MPHTVYRQRDIYFQTLAHLGAYWEGQEDGADAMRVLRWLAIDYR